MRTGYNVRIDATLDPHVSAVITGATTVFTRDLCNDVFRLQMLTGDDDIEAIVRSCAYRLLQTDKCKKLETLVTSVIASDDGRPVIEDHALLSEVMQVYESANTAERQGVGPQFRTQQLIPAIIESASMGHDMNDDEAQHFLDEINQNQEHAAQFVPTTAFEQVVFAAINKVSL